MRRFVICLLLSSMCLTVGCASRGNCNGIVAKYTKVAIRIDGKHDDAAWKDSNVYTMQLSKDRLAEGEDLREEGRVRTAWDDNYFYLGVEFQDSDIVATGDKDQMHHYRFGDLCEMFLKPADKDNYVESYVTPQGRKTSFYIPRQKGDGLSRIDDFICGLEVAAYIGNGTLNKRDDRDQWWSAEMAMPVEDLEKLGEQIRAGSKWRILVARYNYSKLFGEGADEIEYSMTPGLSRTKYHLTNEYARLYLEK